MMFKKYFEQNIDFDKNIAFVDANGYGISIANVASILGYVWEKAGARLFIQLS